MVVPPKSKYLIFTLYYCQEWEKVLTLDRHRGRCDSVLDWVTRSEFDTVSGTSKFAVSMSTSCRLVRGSKKNHYHSLTTPQIHRTTNRCINDATSVLSPALTSLDPTEHHPDVNLAEKYFLLTAVAFFKKKNDNRAR